MNFQDYFQAYNNYFWQWEDDTEVLSISQGSTIAYKQQIIQTLGNMVDDGIPPFGALLLAFSATNNTQEDSVAFIENKLKEILNARKKVYFTNSSAFSDVFIFLNRLRKIPDNYKTGKRRNLMLKTIFANCHNKVNAKTATGLVNKLKTKDFAIKKLLQKKELSENAYQKDFQVIGLLEKKFPTAQSIIDAMGDLPPINDEDLPELITENAAQETYKDFIEELMDNEKTFQVGALIKPIWAGFKIPIFSALPSGQPLGGFSDLSNKGDFDKLLISEYANDDLVFMSRLANNEALYLHREMPPVKDDLQKNILLDVSLKMWGTPKILAHAVYLAIAKHPKSSSLCKAFVIGNTYENISFKHIEDVIDGLQKVDIDLNAGKGIELFFNEVENKKQLEIFYITTQDALKYPAVQKQLIENALAFKYIITTNAEGEISFYRNKNNAQKHLQTIKLPLEKLWAKAPKKKQVIIKDVVEEYFENNYPILFATPKDIKRLLPQNEEEIYCVANKCLFKRKFIENKKNHKGWQLVLRGLTNDGLFEIGQFQNQEIQFLHFNITTRELEITNLATGKSAKTVFNKWKSTYKEFIFKKDKFVHLHQNPNAFYIKLEMGQIVFHLEHVNSINYKNYQDRKNEIDNIIAFGKDDNVVLKNITSVFINGAFNLVFNGHELRLDSNQGFYMRNDVIGNSKWLQAINMKNVNSFQFKDGSTINIEIAGMIVLKSSNENIPTIYLPSVLSASLGIATKNAFAGNEFYYNENFSNVEVVLENSGPTLLNAIKIIKDYTGLGLMDAREIVEITPKLITKNLSLSKAEKMVAELKLIGASATIHKSKNYQQQEIISIFQFQEKYLLPFIQHILAYATTN